MEQTHLLNVVDMGIDTHQEPVAFMREDCSVCKAEGFTASSRVSITQGNKTVIASLNVVDKKVLPEGGVGLSKVALQRLEVGQGDEVQIRHAPVVASLSAVRKKIFGNKLNRRDIHDIIADISEHRYRDIEIASFVSGCAGERLDVDEIIHLTNAMVECGKRLSWPNQTRVFDKHCIGGLPGNRTTPLVVSIVSAAGLVIPKTSSRAITSPAGTADTMETLTRVTLTMEQIQQVVADTGACLAWGGAVSLSPADDVLIRVERALDLDGEGQLIASVLSKKIAAGSTHVVIDIPMGHTAKIRTQQEANRLALLFTQVGTACGIKVRCVITDGTKPVGMGIGPAEEARDVLSVLQNHADAPQDLRQRSLVLAAHLLDMADGCGLGEGLNRADQILSSGKAWQKFKQITAAQGGLFPIPEAKYKHTEVAATSGCLKGIDNRKLSRLAKLAGAPFSKASGLRLWVRVGEQLQQGQPLFSLFSNSLGEQDYALEFCRLNSPIFIIE